jgi:hypothetical protein
MKISRTIGMGIAVAALGVASIAQAQDSGRTVYTRSEQGSASAGPIYAGGALGQGSLSISAPLSTSSDIGYEGFVGYRFNRNISAEAFYVNLGKSTAANSNSGTTGGLGIAVRGYAPITRNVSLTGRFGAANLTTTWSSPVGAGISASQSKVGLMYGIGLAFDAGARTEIRLGYDRYTVGSDDPATGSAGFASLGVAFSF